MTLALLSALFPIALMILLGHWLKRSGFLAEGFWPQAERLGYYVLLPSLFAHGLATAELGDVPVHGMILALVMSTIVVSILLAGSRRFFPVDDAAFTSMFQGGIRFNNYVGVSAAAGLFGAYGVTLAAVANAAIVPTVNILCVLIFARFGTRGRLAARAVCKQIVMNPLVVACAVGITLQTTGIGLPQGLEPVLKALGQASLPLGLLCVGAALELRKAGSWVAPIGLSSVVKFVLMPAVTLIACRLLDLRGEAAVAVLLFQSLPTASSSYIMARQMGGDAPLMAGIIAGQTLIATLALPLAVLGLSRWI